MKSCPSCQRATIFDNECLECGHVEPTFMERYGNVLSGLVLIVAMTFVSVVVLIAVVPFWPLVPPGKVGEIRKIEFVDAVVAEPVVDAKLRAEIRVALGDKTASEIMKLDLLPEPSMSANVSFISADGFYMEVTPEGKIIAPKDVQE